MPPSNRKYRYRSGDKIDKYTIVESVGQGAFSETYKATTPTRRTPVLIKIPRLDQKRFAQLKNMRRLDEITKQVNRDVQALKVLGRVKCVAHLLGTGACTLELDNFTAPALYGVYEFIEGNSLADHLEKQFATGKGRFRGIHDANEFLNLTKKLVSALREVHQLGVIHGDIWYDNVMVRKTGAIVLIDFGAASFRNLMTLSSPDTARPHHFLAPEGTGTVSSDLFAVGMTLLYMATGETADFRTMPPCLPDRRLFEVKKRVTNTLRNLNPAILDNNAGIADVIARCLRPADDRVRSAGELLLDLEMIDPRQGFANVRRSQETFRTRAERLDDPFFRVIATRRIRRLDEAISEMERGVYDITGDHEELVSSFGNYFSRLGLVPGDQYLSTSLPRFWYPGNMGVNGRMLSLNQLAAQRGATIRRVFLLLKSERGDPTVERIVRSHLAVAQALRDHSINTTDRAISSAGWWEGFVEISERERSARYREHEHFGVIVRGRHATTVFPIYRDDDQPPNEMVTLRFRSLVQPEAAASSERFESLLAEATPLETWLPTPSSQP